MLMSIEKFKLLHECAILLQFCLHAHENMPKITSKIHFLIKKLSNSY